MKTILILVAIACACAYALPSGLEVPAESDKEVKIDLDKLKADLQNKFYDADFLQQKFGRKPGVDINTQFSAVVGDEKVNLGGSGSWLKYVPWGTIIDVVVEAIKKATE